MRVAYADPPYPGQSKKHYTNDPSGIEPAEVDHAALIERLMTFDAWALSTSSPALRAILPLTPEGTRVMAWVKPFAVFKPYVRVAYAWEPVLVYGIRERSDRTEPTIPDFVSANITLRRGTHGAKPDQFAYWLFRVLDLQSGDEFHDLFPGSCAMTRCWGSYRNQMSLEEGISA